MGASSMHVVARPRDETLTIKLEDGRIYRVTLRDGEAHVPDHVGRFMIDNGYVAAGSAPNPKPRQGQKAAATAHF